MKPVQQIPSLPWLGSFNTNEEEITKLKYRGPIIHLVKLQETKEIVKFWAEVYMHKDASNTSSFLKLATIVLTILSLPHSHADVERVLSQINFVENKLRNKLSIDAVNSLLHISQDLKRMSETGYLCEFPSDVSAFVTA